MPILYLTWMKKMAALVSRFEAADNIIRVRLIENQSLV